VYKGEGVGEEKENSGKKMEEWRWGERKKEPYMPAAQANC